MTSRNGLSSLLRPEDSVLVLIDHQPYQLANLNRAYSTGRRNTGLSNGF
jgi:hypothetical protein